MTSITVNRRSALMMGAAALLAAVAVLMATPTPSQASSIVFIRGGNVWLMAPNGTRVRQVTRGGGWSSPSQANNGTIVALRKRYLIRVTRRGKRIGKPVPLIGTNSRYSGNFSVQAGPADARVSPNGKYVAYWVGSLTQFCNPVTLLCDQRLQDNVIYTKTNRFTDPKTYGAVRDYREPSWLTNSQTLMFNYGLAETVAVDKVGQGEANLAPWFSDPQGLQLGKGVVPQSGGKLALLRGNNRTGAAQESIVLYSVLGAPPIANGVCQIVSNKGSLMGQPTWAPDGSALAWIENDGIHVAKVPDLASPGLDCTSIVDRLVARGTDAFWGKKSVGRRDGLKRR